MGTADQRRSEHFWTTTHQGSVVPRIVQSGTLSGQEPKIAGSNVLLGCVLSGHHNYGQDTEHSLSAEVSSSKSKSKLEHLDHFRLTSSLRSNRPLTNSDMKQVSSK